MGIVEYSGDISKYREKIINFIENHRIELASYQRRALINLDPGFEHTLRSTSIPYIARTLVTSQPYTATTVFNKESNLLEQYAFNCANKDYEIPSDISNVPKYIANEKIEKELINILYEKSLNVEFRLDLDNDCDYLIDTIYRYINIEFPNIIDKKCNTVIISEELFNIIKGRLIRKQYYYSFDNDDNYIPKIVISKHIKNVLLLGSVDMDTKTVHIAIKNYLSYNSELTKTCASFDIISKNEVDFIKIQTR